MDDDFATNRMWKKPTINSSEFCLVLTSQWNLKPIKLDLIFHLEASI